MTFYQRDLFLEFVIAYVSGVFGILLGFSLDRLIDRVKDGQTKKEFLNLINEELTEIKRKLDLKTNKAEILYTDVWDSAISSGAVRLLSVGQVTELSRVYKSIKSFSFEAEFIKRGFEELEKMPESRKTREPFAQETRYYELSGKYSKNKEALSKEIDDLLKEKWWHQKD
jgi:hypothetical protein